MAKARTPITFQHLGTQRHFLGEHKDADGNLVALEIGSTMDAKRPKGMPDNVRLIKPSGEWDRTALENAIRVEVKDADGKVTATKPTATGRYLHSLIAKNKLILSPDIVSPLFK